MATKIDTTEEVLDQTPDEVVDVEAIDAESEDNNETLTFDFPEEGEEKKSGPEKYYETVGRRKEAIARVRLYTKKTTDTIPEPRALITINEKPYYEYFADENHMQVVEGPLKRLKSMSRFKATVKIKGGGLRGQADAIQNGLAKALVLFDTNFGKKMRKAGFLTRDARVKERKKYGLKSARRAPQWKKR